MTFRLGGDISPPPPNVPPGLKVGEHHPSHCQLFFLMHCLSNAPCVLGGTRVADDKVCEIEWVMFLCRSYVRILVISYMWAPLVTNLLGLCLHVSSFEKHFFKYWKKKFFQCTLCFGWNKSCRRQGLQNRVSYGWEWELFKNFSYS